MSYKLTFLVSREQNGYATYLAKKLGGSSPPYQRVRPNNMCEQFFYFNDTKEANRFLMQAYKELANAKFTLVSLELTERETTE